MLCDNPTVWKVYKLNFSHVEDPTGFWIYVRKYENLKLYVADSVQR